MASKKYTEEMVEFVRKHSSEVHRNELAIMFNSQFDMNLTAENIRWICRQNNIQGKPNFVKGVCPHKNIKYKIGDEFFVAGEWRVLTSTEPKLDILHRSEYKKRVIWEAEYGKIPENSCFIYLDGDKRNCELDNLACVPMLWMRILNQNGWLTGNKEVTLAALKWCELHYSLSKRSGNRYVRFDGSRYR